MNSKSKSVTTTTVGYLCIALSGWIFNMTNAAWFSKFYAGGVALLYPFAIILAVMGILAFLQNRALDAIVFFGMAGLNWWIYGLLSSSAGATEPQSYGGWLAFLVAVLWCYVWFGSFKSGILRMLFLLGLWLGPLAFALGDWSGLHWFIIVGAYLGLVTSILAGIISAMAVITHGRSGDPNQEAAGA